MSNKNSTNKIIYYFKKYWYYEVSALILTLLSICLSIRGNWVIKSLIDEALVPKELDLLIKLSLLFVTLTILSVISQLFSKVLFSKLGEQIVFELRTKMFNHILKLPYDYFVNNKAGDIITRIISDPINVRQTVSAALVDFVTSMLTIVGVLTWLFIVDWKLTLIMLPIIPIFIVIFMIVNKKINLYSQKTQALVSHSTSITQESITGIIDIKVLNAKNYILNKFEKVAKKLASVSVKKNVFMDSANSMGQFLLIPYQAVIIGIGGYWFIKTGQPSIGTLFAYTNFMGVLIQPSLKLIFVISQIAQSNASFNRIYEIFDVLEENDAGLALDALDGNISFNNVSYKVEEKTILKEISTVINPNDKVLIKGKTGSGKTTFVKLLTRLIAPSTGNITIDGIDISELSVTSLRRHVIFIPQETYLFNTTIKDNLILGEKDVSDDFVVDCCKKAQIHAQINNLDNGYNTIVQERGKNFSAGERQRLAIARALIHDAGIIIMDEPTANLDSKTAKNFYSMVENSLFDKTVIIVSHGEVDGLNLNKIITMEDGIIETQASL